MMGREINTLSNKFLLIIPKRNLFIYLLFFSVSIPVQSKSGLQFRPDKTFKIIQFTDIHFRFEFPITDSVLAFMQKAIVSEKPDLVIMTGDIVTSKGTAREGWLAITSPMIEKKVPWTVTLGNHDAESELSRSEIFEILMQLPYNMVEIGPDNVNGIGNFVFSH